MGHKVVKPWSRYTVHRAGMEKAETPIEILSEKVLKKSQLEGWERDERVNIFREWDMNERKWRKMVSNGDI